jgi:RNA polymerase sigma factor (sigma-70 family)
VPQSIPLSAIERATVHHYCFVLYEACAATGSPRQRRAFAEVWARLYSVALYRVHRPDLAQELAQGALSRIWERLPQCRDHGSFLRWCDQVLLSVIREHFREGWTKTETAEGPEWKPKELEVGLAPAALRGEPDMSEMFDGFAKALQAQFVATIRDCLQNASYETVVIELFVNDKTIKQVADQIGTTPGNVSVIKTRALKILRQCDAFLRLYEEWLNEPPPPHS